MPNTFNEGAAAGEFLLSELPGYQSRESGSLTSAVAVAAGTILAINGAGALSAATGAEDEVIAGVLYANHKAGQAGAVQVLYIARGAEVKSGLLTANTGTSAAWTAVVDGLRANGVLIRESDKGVRPPGA